uniref:Protein rp20-26 oh-glycosylation sites n=1 Tax=Lutzomyia longipalpis TaxID=7200 RepID=A0A1B0CG96_LUTLO
MFAIAMNPSSSMMGLQAAASKRKYDGSEGGEVSEQQGSCSPAKTSRWSETGGVSTTPPTMTTSVISSSGLGEDSIARLEAVTVPGETTWAGEPIVDSISRLQAVAVPGEGTWGADGARSALATTLLAADDLEDDDDDFEDDFDEDDTAIPSYLPLRYPCAPPRGYGPPGSYSPPAKNSYYTESYPGLTTCSRGMYGRGPGYASASGWMGGYYTPPEATSPQQTIRCAENGKSYLELGSASYSSNNGMSNTRCGIKRCCDGRNNWCNSKQCYKERRLKMMNLSMFKLSRFRQVSEQSLYRSVLICNTLKCIEREMEMESKELGMHQHHVTSPHHNHHHHMHHPQPPLPQPPHPAEYHPQYRTPTVHHGNHASPEIHYGGPEAPPSSFQVPYNGRAATPAPPSLPFNDSLPPYDHHPLRDAAHSSGRATPFPTAGLPDTDSGYGDEDCTRPINWGSVLSLSSQSALDPLNNNDLFATSSTTSTPALSSSNSSTSSSSSNSCSFAAATTFSFASAASCTVTATTNWDYGLLDMDLGLGPELTELLPSWKLTPLSADDILKSVPEQQEMDSAFTHIMVGS